MKPYFQHLSSLLTSPKLKHYALIAIPYTLITVVTLLTYFPALNNDFILVDDSDQILHHPQIRALSFIPQHFVSSTYYRPESDQSYGLFYRPLMLSTYTLLYTLFGPNPMAFHLTQILLHALNACLFYYLLVKVFAASKKKRKLKIARPEPSRRENWSLSNPFLLLTFCFSLLFALHPINSETILHAANLQDILFVTFGLLALNVLVKNCRPSSTTNSSKTKNSVFTPQLTSYHLLLITSLLLLSLFSKETGILFVIMAVIYTGLFQIQQIKPVLLSVTFATVIYAFFRFQLAEVSFGFDSIAKVTHAPLPQRLLHLPEVILTYLQTFVWPKNLIVFQYWFHDNISLQQVLLPTFVLLVLLAALVYLIHQSKKYDHNIFKVGVFFLLWFFLGLLMHSHLSPLSQTVAERWFYFPSLGLIGIMFLITYHLSLKTYKPAPTSSTQIANHYSLIVMAALLALAIRTHLRTYDWRDSKTLFTHDLQLQIDDAYFLQNSLASVYLAEKNYAAAKPLVETSIKQYPYFGNLNNLAIIYTHENNPEQAQAFFELALAKDGNYTAYQNYANVMLHKFNQPEQAKQISQTALQRYPYAPHLWTILALSENQLAHAAEATQAAQQAYYLQAEPYTLAVLEHITQAKPFNPADYFDLN